MCVRVHLDGQTDVERARKGIRKARRKSLTKPAGPGKEVDNWNRSTHACRSLSNLASRLATSSSLTSSHSHTVMTRHPVASSCLETRPSRAIFPLSFASQKARRVVGIVAFRHPSCWCQKHPCTKTTAKRATNTITGFPGNSFRRNENESPSGATRSEHVSPGAYRDCECGSCSSCGALV